MVRQAKHTIGLSRMLGLSITSLQWLTLLLQI